MKKTVSSNEHGHAFLRGESVSANCYSLLGPFLLGGSPIGGRSPGVGSPGFGGCGGSFTGGFRCRSGGGLIGGFRRRSGGGLTGGFFRLGGSFLSTGRAMYCIDPICYFPCASSILARKSAQNRQSRDRNRSDSRKGAKRAKWDTANFQARNPKFATNSNDQNTKIQNMIIRTRVFGFFADLFEFVRSSIFGFRN